VRGLLRKITETSYFEYGVFLLHENLNREDKTMTKTTTKRTLTKPNITTQRKYGGTTYIVKTVFNPAKTETITQKVERLLLKV